MELTYIAIAFLNESWRLKCPEGPTRKVNTSAKLEVKFFIWSLEWRIWAGETCWLDLLGLRLCPKTVALIIITAVWAWSWSILFSPNISGFCCCRSFNFYIPAIINISLRSISPIINVCISFEHFFVEELLHSIQIDSVFGVNYSKWEVNVGVLVGVLLFDEVIQVWRLLEHCACPFVAEACHRSDYLHELLVGDFIVDSHAPLVAQLFVCGVALLLLVDLV